jgi:hypothetical protein
LDYRLIDPEADDHPGSKANAAVERIYEIWRESAADRGTQLVFCDLSTPKGGFKAVDKPVATELELAFEDDSLFAGEDEADADAPHSPDTVEEGDDDGEDATTARFMDDVVSLSARFSVYDDVKRKLVDKGIPADEIAFIHDANTDLRKAKLFSDMQAGRVRILMGSTSKMGAGMNVQKRLVAAHHLDAPWRPSDLEQRNGRIIRQGNSFYERDPDNFKVGVYYYATKRTYDARMWQTITVSPSLMKSIICCKYTYSYTYSILKDPIEAPCIFPLTGYNSGYNEKIGENFGYCTRKFAEKSTPFFTLKNYTPGVPVC